MRSQTARLSVCVTVDKYNYIVSGEELGRIEQFMQEEHTFEEYCEVRPILTIVPPILISIK